MSAKNGYKTTAFGDIPVGWNYCKIGEVAAVTKLAGFEFTEYMDYVEDGEIIAIRALNLKKGKLDLNQIKRIKRAVSEQLVRSRLYIDDILFSYVGTIGETAIVDEDNKYHLAPNVAKITPFASMNAQFLHQYLRSEIAKKEINEHLTTTSQPALSMGNLRDIFAPVPPLHEQQKIADILSTIDDHISETESLIEKTKVLKQGMMQRLLTHGIGHTEFKDTEIGRIPVEWEVDDLSKRADLIMGQSPNSESYNSDVDGLPFFQGKSEFGDKYPKVKVWCSSPIKIAPPDSILISVRAPVGAINLNVFKACIGRGLAAIVPHENLSLMYMYFFFQLYSFRFEQVSQGSTFTAINNNDLKSFKISFPPRPEQQQIAAILTSIDDQIDSYQTKLTALTKLKSALMQQLLTGKTRVKI